MFIKLGENDWTAERWRWFRFGLGLYVLVHFMTLLPWSAEMFSSAGMFADPATSPLMGFLPNPLGTFQGPLFTIGFVGLGVVAGACMMANKAPRIGAVVAWYIGACLLAKNPLILNPAMPHVGWTLLWFAAVATPKGDGSWRLPRPLFTVAWLLMGLVMSWSAVTKLGSISWMDGSALHWVWENPLARDTVLRETLVSLPSVWVQGMTWGVLALELLVLPAALLPRLRTPIWWALLAMHLGLLLTVNFTDLSMGMLIVHMSLFNARYLPSWLQTRLRSLSRRRPPHPLIAHHTSCNAPQQRDGIRAVKLCVYPSGGAKCIARKPTHASVTEAPYSSLQSTSLTPSAPIGSIDCGPQEAWPRCTGAPT